MTLSHHPKLVLRVILAAAFGRLAGCVLFLAVAGLLGPYSAGAAVTLGFAGVDGTIRDGLLHNPPNVHLAVGTGAGASGRVVMVTSNGIQVWDKTGASLDGPTPLDTFFGTAVGHMGTAKILFDEHAGRFFVVGLEGRDADPMSSVSAIHVAVSSTSAPANVTTDWLHVSGNAITTVGGDATYVVGPPGIGADANALFITGNLADDANAFRGTKIRVFDTSATTGLLAGMYAFVDLDVDAAVFPVSFYLQPAHVHGTTDSGNFYLVNRVNGFGQSIGRYRVWEIAGAPAAPTIVRNNLQGWDVGGQRIGGGPQAGTLVQLDTFMVRLADAQYRDGHIWVVQTAEKDGRDGIEAVWTKLATNGGAPAAITLDDLGIVKGSDGPEWVFNPSIAVAASGDATICFTQSYFDQFPEMRCAVRAASDPAGTFQPSFHVASSPGFYDSTSFPGLNFERWGLYSSTITDPDDDATVWSANETVLTSAVDASIWSTFVARLGPVTPLPPPAPVPLPEAGGLVLRDVFSPRLLTPAMNGAKALGVPADGRHVYLISQFGTLLGLQRRASDGKLRPVEAISPVGGPDPPNIPDRPDYMLPIADGTQVYVLDHDGIKLYQRDVGTGLLTFVEALEQTPFGSDLGGAEQMALSPDERHAYLANGGNDSVVVLARNTTTGHLTFVNEIVNRQTLGVGGVPLTGLRRTRGVVVSPDGAYVYLISPGQPESGGQALIVFARNATSGDLTHRETIHQSDAGIEGLETPESIVMSPDGQNLYITSEDEDVVTVWTRNAVTGHPTLLEKHGPSTGLHNLKTPHGLAISADGTRVYVTSTGGDALEIFSRDPTTGALTLFAEELEGTNGVRGLINVLRVAVSPDGRSVYTVSPGFLKGASFFNGVNLDLGALVHFQLDECGSGFVSSVEQCDDGNTMAGDGCSDTCTLELCPPLPRNDCRHPASRSSRLKVKLGRRADKDQLTWDWKHGAITPASDFGDPLMTASSLLCLYRDSPAPELAATFAAPAAGFCDGAPCWQSQRNGSRFAYTDDAGTPDGLVQLRLQEGLVAGKSIIQVKGAGRQLPLPTMPLALPVTVQFTNSDTGVCWEARYTTAQKNDPSHFTASGD